MSVSKGLMYGKSPTIKTSARIANALLQEFGSDDAGVVLDWLLETIQRAQPRFVKKKARR